MNNNEMGNVSKTEGMDEKKDKAVAPNTLVGRDVVNCPITVPVHSVVEIDFCKKQCSWFGKIIEGSDSTANRVECKYPRFIEIINVCGERK